MNEGLFPEALVSKIQKTGIVAVLVVDNAADAVPLAETLLKAGINIMELTLRTPAAIESLKAIVKNAPEMAAGIGTILFPGQLEEVMGAGAAFGVAPGMNPNIVKMAADAKFPFAPGIATPSDIEAALGFGCRILKFFPAESMGGLKHLENMSAPYAHLNLKYIPLGGLNQNNFAAYLKNPSVIAVGGSWLAKRDEISCRKWNVIADKAKRAVAAVKKARDEA